MSEPSIDYRAVLEAGQPIPRRVPKPASVVLSADEAALVARALAAAGVWLRFCAKEANHMPSASGVVAHLGDVADDCAEGLELVRRRP